MNAVEIEQAITDLAEQPFDPANFSYAFLEAFGNKETTIKRLRAGASNKSDLGSVLQTNNIHILTCEAGQVTNALKALKDIERMDGNEGIFVRLMNDDALRNVPASHLRQAVYQHIRKPSAD